MAQEKFRSLIRKARRDPQEDRDCPIHCLHRAIAPGFDFWALKSTQAERSYQLQLTISDSESTRMMEGLARTGVHSSRLPFSSSTIANQIERPYLSLVAKQEEFCCGPRQGN